MKYSKIVKGIFIDRPNRFIAHVEINGKVETVHVKNTGRCKELLIPGVTVILEDFSERIDRKTKYDLIAVYKQYPESTETLLINMDSQAPNKVMKECLEKQTYSLIKPEYTIGKSRIDFYCEKQTNGRLEKWLIEVKGCTLEKNGTGYFPDAPTERGVKHLEELTNARSSGYNCAVAFVIQMEGISEVKPNVETHPEFGEAIKKAKEAGVEVWFLCCKVNDDELIISRKLQG